MRVLGHVRQRLGDDEVGGGLDRRRQPLVRNVPDLDRQRRASRECPERRPEPLLGQHRRVDPLRQLAQLLERGSQLGIRLGQQLAGAVRLRAELISDELQREAEAEQPLLGAVVQIALEPAPLLVAGRDDPRARGTQLHQLRAQLRLQPLVLERQPCRRARRLEQPRPLEQRGVVHERRDWSLGRTEHRHRPTRPGRRQLERPPLAVDVRRSLGQPERQLERGIAERPRECVPHRARWRPLQLDHEIGHRAAPGPAPEHARGEHERDRERDERPPTSPRPSSTRRPTRERRDGDRAGSQTGRRRRRPRPRAVARRSGPPVRRGRSCGEGAPRRARSGRRRRR